MATTRIGFFADPHYPHGYSESVFASDTDHLYNTLSSDIVIWGGDQMSGGVQSPPHFTEENLRDFWTMVDNNGDLSTTYAVPGNHDIPIPYYEKISRDYIGDRAETPQKVHLVDGVTCLLVNSCGPGSVDGGEAGVGMTSRYIPLTELEWLIGEVKEAHSRGDVVLLFTHAGLWFSSNARPPSHHPEAPFSDRTLATAIGTETPDSDSTRFRHSYFIVSNYQTVMEQLASNGPICVFHGDEFYSGWEGYENIDGVYYTWQDHWNDPQGGERNTTSYVDVDTSTGRVLYKTVNPDRTENVVMDVTPSW